MGKDSARLTGRSAMPPFSMICPKCKRTYFKPNGGDTSCPECSTKMVDRDKSPTIFAKDVKQPKKTKIETKSGTIEIEGDGDIIITSAQNVKTTKETKGQNKGSEAS